MAGAARVRRNLGAGASWLWRSGAARLRLPRGRFWLRLRLSSPIPEIAAPSLFSRGPALGYTDVLRALDAARDDPRVAGVVVRFTGPPGGLARAAGLRRALAQLRESGRPVVAWSERWSSVDLHAASGASHVLLPESGSVWLVGLRLEGYFLRNLLDRLGLKADVVRVGEFKSAGEMFTRSGASPEQREQLESLADDLFRVLVDGVAEGRELAPDRVRELVDRAPFTAREAVDAGLVDGCRYPDEIEPLLLELAPGVGKPDAVPAVEAAAYLALRGRDLGAGWLDGDRPRFAVVVASGNIHSGSGPRGVASDPYRQLLEALRRDESLDGVLVRIESPGGDAVASDLLWRGLRQIGEERPIVASLGDVAASGGYFLAAGAGDIVTEEASITGSIGVVGGKLDVSGLYEQLGVRKEAVERGARAGLLAEDRPFDAQERGAVRHEMEALYELFLDRVAAGRELDRDAVHAVGQGRVWSGRQARERGLADALGGPLEALELLSKRAEAETAPPLLLAATPRGPRWLGLGRLARPRRFSLP